jgi:hypothetical protein
MRSRFATGDTYEASDVGTTRQLVEAAHKYKRIVQQAGIEPQ